MTSGLFLGITTRLVGGHDSVEAGWIPIHLKPFEMQAVRLAK